MADQHPSLAGAEHQGTAPLVIEFEVSCDADHAFRVWTERINSWWPKDHAMSGEPDVVVTMESGLGGRIFERTNDGQEYDWGEITRWDPPHRLAYHWHIGATRKEATHVDVSFTPVGPATAVRLEHSMWDQFGPAASTRRQANAHGWSDVVAAFRTAT